MIQFVQKDRGGELYIYLSRTIDTGNTPTVKLISESGSTFVASQNATKGPNTTLDDSASSGQKVIPLTATTSINGGEKYRIGPNSIGQFEDVTVDTLTSGVSVTVRDDLNYSYASGDVFRSQKLTVSVTADEADEIRHNCQAEWTFESDSQEYAEYSTFYISLYCPSLTVHEQDILKREPKAKNMLASRQPLREYIQDIFNREILGDIAEIMPPGSIITASAVHSATIHRVIAELALSNDKLERYDKRMEAYRAELSRATRLVDTDEDQETDDEIVYSPMAVRIIRG